MINPCGAKTRAGTPCRKAPVSGSKRCMNHGGKSTGSKSAKGNTNAVKHGIYSQQLTANEAATYSGIALGSVDDEIRITRIRLARALAAEHKAGGKPELDEVTKNEGGGQNAVREVRKSRVRDYFSVVDRLTGRVESLEKTRAELLKMDTSGQDNEPKPQNFVFHVVDGRKAT